MAASTLGASSVGLCGLLQDAPDLVAALKSGARSACGESLTEPWDQGQAELAADRESVFGRM